MAAPPLDTDHRGLRVLAEVATILSGDLASRAALVDVVATLRRGLDLRRCRLWLRNDAGTGYAPFGTPADEIEDAGRGKREPLPRVAEWIRQGPYRENTPAGQLVRLPLVQDEAPLGALEAVLPPGPPADLAHDVLVVCARLLTPLLGAAELSRDLASEVALRTREVEAQRNFVARIIDSLPVGLYVIDRAYRIRAWNRKRETGTQGVARDEAVGRQIFDVLDRQPRALLKREFDRVFATGEIQQMEMESQSSGGMRHYRITKIPMRLDDREISHVITIGEDVTEWRQAQQQLSQTDKLAALGQLAAGVMHEINNPLATILACAEALALRTEVLPEAERASYEEFLKIIDSEVQRCRRIVDGLLDFSRPKARATDAIDVNQVVEQTLFLLKHHDRFKHLTLVRELAPDLPALRGDGERLVQSFMALMLNALDAMDARGVLTVRTQINAQRGDEVLVEFIDTGRGIAQEQLPKIFEPFFTTKSPGRGTGLGLSICYGIIQEHRGRIEVESQLGVGSDFKVYLPTG
jgi:two-component system NtrC family sensor kinase